MVTFCGDIKGENIGMSNDKFLTTENLRFSRQVTELPRVSQSLRVFPKGKI